MMKPDKKRGLKSVGRSVLRPRVGFTPASGIFDGEIPVKLGRTYHVPLVVESSPLKRGRSYRKDGRVKILAVGKYQNMAKKRHDLLMRAVHVLLQKGYDLSLTFVGSGYEQDRRLKSLIALSQKLEIVSRVNFKLNVCHEKMNEV